MPANQNYYQKKRKILKNKIPKRRNYFASFLRARPAKKLIQITKINTMSAINGIVKKSKNHYASCLYTRRFRIRRTTCRKNFLRFQDPLLDVHCVVIYRKSRPNGRKCSNHAMISFDSKNQ